MSVPLSILHFIPGLHFREGGPSHSVIRLTDSLASDKSLSITLASHAVWGQPSVQSANALVNRKSLVSSNQLALKLGLVDRRLLLSILMGEKNGFNLVHTHSVWHPSNYWVTQMATKRRIPIICQPRGMLEPWALARSAWKKRFAAIAYQNHDLESASAFVATSYMEAANIRSFGLKQPVAIIPNGVDLPATQSNSEDVTSKPDGDRIVLFLSRIHPKKGLLVLLDAWARCHLPGWRLQLVGPDEDGYLRQAMKRVTDLGISGSVDYAGELRGKPKAEAYRSADLFVLPSFSENFGMVVAEALSLGVPVITTNKTPWHDLKEYGCGWWIETGVEPLVNALRESMALSDDERSQMGESGKNYVARYNWTDTAQKTARFYRWICGQSERPDFLLDD